MAKVASDQAAPSHSQVICRKPLPAVPPNITNRPRSVSKAMQWLLNGPGLAGSTDQLLPSNCRKSASGVLWESPPPYSSMRCRIGSYAIACPLRGAGKAPVG